MVALSKTRQLSLIIIGTVLSTLGNANVSQALTLVTDRAALGANETLDWNVLGPARRVSLYPSPITVSASGGTQVTGSLLGPSQDYPEFGRFYQRPSVNGVYAGNFALGDAVLGGAYPMQFTFSNTLRGVGTQIQNDAYAPFTAVIEAFDSSGISLGSFTRDGISGSGRIGDNSTIFIGVLSDNADIAKVTFNIQGNIPGDIDSTFAINRLSLNSPVTAVPTPALLPGLIGIGIAVIRKCESEQKKTI